MRPSRVLLCVLVLVAALLPARAQREGFVSARGKQIVKPDGTALELRGVNLGNWLVPEGYMFGFDSATSPRLIEGVFNELVGPEEAGAFWTAFRRAYITREDIRFIRDLGLNSVRVPFNWRLFTSPTDTSVWQGPGWALIDSVVAWAGEAGLWVVLDMHCAPGGQTGDNIDDSWGYPFLFDSPGEQRRTIELWRRIALRHRDNPTVIGYDLLNEPIPHFVDTLRLNPLLEPLYRRIVAAIREVDPHHLIFLGGGQWDTNFSVFGPPFDRALVYTFHRYWCDTTQAMVEEYVAFRDRYDVPIWMGESGENTDAWIAAFRRLLERNSIGWCFWPYKKLDSPRGVVTFDRPAGWEKIVAYADAPRSSYATIRALRPPVGEVRAALEEFVRLCRFQKVRVNRSYVEALSCRVPDAGK